MLGSGVEPDGEQRRPSGVWLVPVIGLVGYWAGHVLLPMRWWRHGDIPLYVPATLLGSIALTAISKRGSALRLLAIVGWATWGFMLASVLVWIGTWNKHLMGAAIVWGGTVVAVLVLTARDER